MLSFSGKRLTKPTLERYHQSVSFFFLFLNCTLFFLVSHFGSLPQPLDQTSNHFLFFPYTFAFLIWSRSISRSHHFQEPCFFSLFPLTFSPMASYFTEKNKQTCCLSSCISLARCSHIGLISYQLPSLPFQISPFPHPIFFGSLLDGLFKPLAPRLSLFFSPYHQRSRLVVILGTLCSLYLVGVGVHQCFVLFSGPASNGYFHSYLSVCQFVVCRCLLLCWLLEVGGVRMDRGRCAYVV